MVRAALAALCLMVAVPAFGAEKHPDLSGVWVISNRSTRGYLDVKGQPMKELPYTAWGREQRAKHHPALDPSAKCLTMFPRHMGWPYPLQVVQAPKSTVILFEADTTWRQIYTDGRKIDPDTDPAWMGHSIGHWEGDVLVAETRGVNDQAWLDGDGAPLSDQLHVTERIRRIDNGKSLEITMTIEDPKVFTQPLMKKLVYNLKPDWSLKEYVCEEGNRDDPNNPRDGLPGSLSLPGAEAPK